MSRQANPKLIGAFVVGAAALAVAALVAFGSGNFLKEQETFVLYFDGSLNGLTVGSPVKIRGVEVGTVTDILVVADETGKFRIPVYINVDLQKFVYEGEGPRPKPEQAVPRLIEHGLRAQLAMESLVTGQLYIEIAFHPRTPVVLSGANGDYPELPTIPSTIEQLAEKFQQLPADELSATVLSTLQGIERMVNSPHVEEILARSNETFGLARELLARADERVGGLTATTEAALQEARSAAIKLQELLPNLNSYANSTALDIKTTLASIRAVLEQARDRVEEVGNITQLDSPFQHDMSRALEQIAAAAGALRRLAEYLQRHPESLIYGKGHTRARP